jgi:predicted nucleic acid-binding protein
VLQRHCVNATCSRYLISWTFVKAAGFFNRCRAKGVQGSNTDFLLCALALRRKIPILTNDADFAGLAKWLRLELHRPR